jgi:hypothetical protein
MGRRVLAAGALALATGCGMQAGGERVCTAIGTVEGVQVEVDHREAAAGTVEVCWDGKCVTAPLRLHPATTVAGGTCSGNRPNDVCGASVVPTDALTGFATVAGLPAKPVTVTLRLTDSAGVPVVDRRLDITPSTTYPNGPRCPAGAAQARLHVSADGAVSER